MSTVSAADLCVPKFHPILGDMKCRGHTSYVEALLRVAGLREIVVDPQRCPLTFSEFTLKEFERDNEGHWIDDIPDGNDYSIDAVRYALMDDVLRG